MLEDVQRDALKRWYARDEVLAEARSLFDKGSLEELEDYLHRICLLPLSNHDELPDYLRDAEGKPLFPKSLNPRLDEANWQDAIELGWEVMAEELGFTHDDVHRAIAKEQKEDWAAWMESVERRKREREQS